MWIKQKDFTDAQWRLISLGIKRKYKMELVELYAQPCFNASQMKEIMNCIEDNLDIEQIKLIANSKYSANEMSKMRLKQ